MDTVLAEYVHMNIKAYLWRLWARIRRKFRGESRQLELNLWTRRTKLWKQPSKQFETWRWTR